MEAITIAVVRQEFKQKILTKINNINFNFFILITYSVLSISLTVHLYLEIFYIFFYYIIFLHIRTFSHLTFQIFHCVFIFQCRVKHFYTGIK